MTGALPSSAVGGTTTNDSAAAGVVGQFIESEVLLAAAVTLASGATTDITSVSLTAGDWDVWGLVALELTSTINHFFGALSLVSATFPTYPGKGAMFVLNDTAAIENPASPVGQRRVSVASTTTVWLVGGAGFSAGTAKAYGYIGARRARSEQPMPEAKIPVAHEGSGAMVVTTGIFDPRIFDHKVYRVERFVRLKCCRRPACCGLATQPTSRIDGDVMDPRDRITEALIERGIRGLESELPPGISFYPDVQQSMDASRAIGAMAPHGIPWQQMRPSENVEDKGGQADAARGAEFSHGPPPATPSPLAVEAGFRDVGQRERLRTRMRKGN